MQTLLFQKNYKKKTITQKIVLSLKSKKYLYYFYVLAKNLF